MQVSLLVEGSVSRVDMPRLRIARDGVTLAFVSELSEISLPGLTTPPQLYVVHAPHLTSLSAPALTSLHNLMIDNAAAIPSLAGLEQLQTITGDLTLTRDAQLSSLAALANLTSVGGDVTVTDDPAVPPDDLAALLARLGR